MTCQSLFHPSRNNLLHFAEKQSSSPDITEDIGYTPTREYYREKNEYKNPYYYQSQDEGTPKSELYWDLQRRGIIARNKIAKELSDKNWDNIVTYSDYPYEFFERGFELLDKERKPFLHIDFYSSYKIIIFKFHACCTAQYATCKFFIIDRTFFIKAIYNNSALACR